MIVCVIGGASSKKSEYAEGIVKNICKLPPVYLATMLNSSCEDEKIIQRHRKLRSGKGFITVEKPYKLYEISLPECDTVLLEDVSNLVANEFFAYEPPRTSCDVFDDVKKGLDFLTGSAKNLVIVTGNVFEDGIMYDETTEEYLKTFAQINRYIARISDVFIEMINGQPLFYKGSFDL